MTFDQQETFSVEPVAITAQDRLEEFGMSLSPDIDYDLEKIFPKVEGWGWKVPFKSKYKLLRHLESLLKDCLFEGEKVLFLAKGNQHSLTEAVFMGIWAHGINHTVFVLTNVRLLMFRTNSRGKPKKTFWMVYYNQIVHFKGNWHGMLNLKLKDGRRLSFSGFSRQDRKEMPTIFTQALEAFRQSEFNPPVSQSLENLCSHCLDKVSKDEYFCETCGAKFWSPKELALRSLIFPSWGDFLMGHHFIAFLEMFGGLSSWTFLLVRLSGFLTGADPTEMVSAILFFLIVNGSDAMLTYHIARKGLHPRSLPAERGESITIESQPG